MNFHWLGGYNKSPRLDFPEFRAKEQELKLGRSIPALFPSLFSTDHMIGHRCVPSRRLEGNDTLCV